MRIGILALQGCVAPHQNHLQSLGVETQEVRSGDELEQCSGLIIPGGESTTMLRLLNRANLFSVLKDYVAAYPTWGICAGAILLAKQVKNPEQESLGVMNISAHRNYYGSQLDSFKADLQIVGLERPLGVDFIRAPLLRSIGSEVEALAQYRGEGVLFREGHLFVSAFHSELGDDDRLHKIFVDSVVS